MALGTALLCAAAPPLAGASTGERAGGAAEDPFAKAGELLQKGQEKYDTADYVHAIELWEQAFEALPDSPEAAQYRSILVYQIASACRDAYEQEGEVKYLKRAESLLEQYIESLAPDDEESRTTATEKLEDVRAKISEEEDAAAARRAAEQAEAGEVEGPPEPPPPPENDREPPGKALLISGSVSAGVGGALLIVMGVMLGQGNKADTDGEAYIAGGGDPADPTVGELIDKGRSANTVALATGITGGVLLVTGAALIAVHQVKTKRAMAFSPTVGRGFAGITLRGRF